MKFKVGDKVKVAKRVMQNGDRTCYWTDSMEKYFGLTGVVRRINNGTITVNFLDDFWAYLPECLELATPSLPINITFNNKYEHQAVQQFLFDNGCKWCYTGSFIQDYENRKINIDDQRKMHNDDIGFNTAPTYTIADLDTIKEILNYKNPISTLQLNPEHTAEINKDTKTVKVGCQTFTFDKVNELARVINEN